MEKVDSFKNFSLKGSSGTKIGSSIASLQKPPFGSFMFKSVAGIVCHQNVAGNASQPAWTQHASISCWGRASKT